MAVRRRIMEITPCDKTDNCSMRSEHPMPQLPKLPPKVDFLKHFDRHCAAVKLLALLLIVLQDWGRTALYVGIPSGVGLVIARYWA